MDETRQLIERFFAALESRDWARFAEVLHPDVVYEIPQSRERIHGRDRYVQFNREFPGDWHLAPTSVLVEGAAGVGRFDWRLGQGRTEEAFAFFGVRERLLATVTDFWPEPYDPPTGREHLTQRW
ncbi:MAG: nuclear transport factor 2 family protein [Geodermatophilaceae bacterium]|nr:nuclear transport factor 2 family protein [Geodermatophilaceae bacterium]